MIRVLEYVIALALVAVLFVIVGLVLPSHRHLEESVETNRKITIVYDTLNNVHRLKDWNQMLPNLPSELTYTGGTNGVGEGAAVAFASASERTWKQGQWRIVSSQAPENGGSAKISYAITDGMSGKDKQTVYTLEPSGKGGRNVKITQSYDVNYGLNLFGRYVGLYLSRSIGDAMKSSLTVLSDKLTEVPNYDYRADGTTLADLKVIDLPAENLLIVDAGNIERRNEEIKKSINDNREWIKRVMDANGLEAAGSMRIITTELGTERYAFDVALPVRKKTTTTAPNSDAETAITAVDNTPLDVKIPDGAPVKYVHTPAQRTAHASYTGYMAELDAARNALRAWAVTSGEEVVGRPYESWNSSVDDSFTIDGSFDIYWAVK